ncbi:MAG: cytochrome C [Ignavibacteriales bacterium CG_4_9_14_3_um_filter_30_11]|nr:MAG: cytochrome C [Ignavibacteriales bacterium CG_4_9_14_3_um_filter_30_11]
MKKRKFPGSFYNPITAFGTTVIFLNIFLIIFLLLFDYLSGSPKAYMGIVTFIVLPFFLFCGIAIALFGIWREHNRIKSGKSREKIFPVIDLNDKKYRSALILLSIGLIVLIIFSAFGTFKAYEYTDSDEFCGEICHKVMNPEYTTYQYSPHARVGCVQCHIGSGTEWYVRAKLSGIYQIYSVLFNKYSKPIPTPVHNLRPAQGTCEQCHWPKYFYRESEITNTYFLSDKNNTKWNLTLLMKIGGGNEETGVIQGIHWHMNLSNKVTYMMTDDSRQEIPWIKSEHSDGTVTIYKTTDFPVTDDMVKNGLKRRMDCIDCHNRPAHIYHPPSSSINRELAINKINPKLPFVKSLAVKILDTPYSSKEIALDSIKIAINNFYNLNYPEIAASMKDEISNSIIGIQTIFEKNYFPSMNVSWKGFPNNIGHLYAKGCFRCHDGKHQTEDGKVLSRDCNTCHTILAQELKKGELRISLGGVDYIHPVNIGDAWKNENCSNCHSN